MVGEPPRQALLVEGVDDKHVVRHLYEQRNKKSPPFGILDKGGFPDLKDAISPEIKSPNRTALGILADANDKPHNRWGEIAHQIKQAVGQAVELPTAVESTGTIVEVRPRVGIWLMPDNLSPGELEDFIKQLIPAGDPVWPRAQHYIDDIPAADRKFNKKKILRAKINAWLAARKEPRKMGAAIGIGDLEATAPLAIRFTDWLQRLFG